MSTKVQHEKQTKKPNDPALRATVAQTPCRPTQLPLFVDAVAPWPQSAEAYYGGTPDEIAHRIVFGPANDNGRAPRPGLVKVRPGQDGLAPASKKAGAA